ncbi:MAG: MMPL family transporter [Candidatus Bipolaricaulota bacterium]|nr:MMPL family transporter [Candidatus Bipolaricaulota bacterium]MDW8152093.1 MMPL family transporter [Candidatus Bipolaricaulota bacterium]
MRRLARWVTDHPFLVLAAVGLVTLAFAAFLPRIGFQADYSKMLPEDDPIVAQYKRTRDLFGGQSLFLLAIVAEEGGTLFDLPSLQKLYALTAELEKLKEEGLVEEVLTPANVKVVEGTEAALVVRPILPGPPATVEEVELFRRKALAERTVRDNLVLADGRGALAILRLSPAVEVREDIQAQILARLEALAAQYAGPEEFHLSGNAAFLVYVNRYMRQDLAFLLPVVVGVVVLVLLVSFRHAWGVVLPLGVVGVGLVWTMGLVGLTGHKLTMISTFLPVVLVAVGSAYGIHVVNEYFQRVARGEAKKAAVQATIQEMFVPVLGAAVTTAAGFLTLLSSFLVPTREFGLFAAFGVMACFLLAMAMIPALLLVFPVPKVRPTKLQMQSAQVFARALARRPSLVLLGVLLVLIGLGAGIPRLRVESDVTRYFREDSPVVQGLRVVDERFGGSQELSIVLDTGRRDGLKDPEVLRFMDRLQRFLEAQPDVGATSSLVDLVKESYFTLRGDDPAFYAIPETSRAVAQVLLLYEMGGGEVTKGLATRDFRVGRIAARVRSVGLSGYDALLRAVEGFVAQEKPAAVKDWYVTGSPSLYIQLSKKLIASQLASLGTSFGAVGFIVAVLLLSLGAGLLALIPLLVAVAGNFGVMGYAGAYLDMATVMIASLTVGIGVDYAVHFLNRYRNARGLGLAHEEALAETFRTSGRAIVVNALTLALGFLVMLLSRFGALNTFGWLIALTMVTSMLGALWVLPAVLAWVPEGAYQPWPRLRGLWARVGLLGADPNPSPKKEGKDEAPRA